MKLELIPRTRFKILDFVHIGKMPPYMSHFEHDIDAIVADYKYNTNRIGNIDFVLYLMEKEKIINRVCWYEESQLTFIKSDIYLASKLIDNYLFDYQYGRVHSDCILCKNEKEYLNKIEIKTN